MKTQTNTNKMTKLVFVALTLMTLACSKNSGGGAAQPGPVIPNCTIQPCAGGVVGGQMLYGGTTTYGYNTQAQFQVFGDQSGNGPGSIAGTVNINNYVCEVGTNKPNLNGPFTIQMIQQGLLNSDVFTGKVNLVGPQGTIPADIEVVPTRTQSAGLITIWLCGYANKMNF